MGLNFIQKDRAVGSLIGMACGDALGSGYEFKPAVKAPDPIQMSQGSFGHAIGEWTDDTSMAIAIAEVAARGVDLREEAAQDEICENWWIWKQSAKDVGNQTRVVINRGGEPATASAYRAASAALHVESGRTAGNGSLMRTAPVALAYLNDRAAMAEVALAISGLTHFDPVAGQACVLWCEAIRVSVLNGTLTSPLAGLDLIPAENHSFWQRLVEEAEANAPDSFNNNGWVVHAFQAAWSAIHHTAQEISPSTAEFFEAAITAAVRVGNDTDTVAAIAGQLVGATTGSSAAPANWLTAIHGYPGYSAKDLTRLGILTVQSGVSQDGGWPAAPITNYQTHSTPAARELVPGLYLGAQSALQTGHEFDAVVSLSRVGMEEGNLDFTNHIRVSVLDSDEPELNPHLEFQFRTVATFIKDRLSAGQKVLLHCVHAYTRTPSFAIAYLMLAEDLEYEQAESRVREILPSANLHEPFGSTLRRLI